MDILVLGRRGRRGVCGAIAFCIDTSITTAFCYIIFAGVGSFGVMRCFFLSFFLQYVLDGEKCMCTGSFYYFLGFGGRTSNVKV